MINREFAGHFAPPGLVLLNCAPAPSTLTQTILASGPTGVFLPYGFDQISPFQTTPESHFDLSLRGLIRTRRHDLITDHQQLNNQE